MLAAVHAYMYFLLQMEDYVLLAGTIGLLLALALVMYVTRNVDWFAIGLPPARPAPLPAAGNVELATEAQRDGERGAGSGFLSSRHSRESGNPGRQARPAALDPRFRGDDDRKMVLPFVSVPPCLCGSTAYCRSAVDSGQAFCGNSRQA